MGNGNAQTVTKQEEAIPFVFYAALTLVLGAMGVAAGGVGVLGLMHYPQVDFLTDKTALFCTSVGSALGAVFLLCGLLFSSKADQLTPYDQIRARNLRIQRGENELRLVTKRFHQRIDILSALPKEQKFDCMEGGEWTLHEDEGEHYIIGKFSYLVNQDEEKRCRVRLRVLPYVEGANSPNIYFQKRNKRLILVQNGEMIPFRGVIANNYLMQKAWIFAGRNFDSMISA